MTAAMTAHEETEILAVLRAVSADDPTVLVPQGNDATWQDIYCGDIEFQFRGWTVRVFNDCGGWDYIDRVTAPDGRAWNYDEMTEPVRFWSPTTDAGWSPGASS